MTTPVIVVLRRLAVDPTIRVSRRLRKTLTAPPAPTPRPRRQTNPGLTHRGRATPDRASRCRPPGSRPAARGDRSSPHTSGTSTWCARGTGTATNRPAPGAARGDAHESSAPAARPATARPGSRPPSRPGHSAPARLAATAHPSTQTPARRARPRGRPKDAHRPRRPAPHPGCHQAAADPRTPARHPQARLACRRPRDDSVAGGRGVVNGAPHADNPHPRVLAHRRGSPPQSRGELLTWARPGVGRCTMTSSLRWPDHDPEQPLVGPVAAGCDR